MRLAQRQLFEHLVGGGGIRNVQDERDAGTSLRRIPLVDLAIEIEFYGLPDFRRQDRPGSGRVDAGVHGSDAAETAAYEISYFFPGIDLV